MLLSCIDIGILPISTGCKLHLSSRHFIVLLKFSQSLLHYPLSTIHVCIAVLEISPSGCRLYSMTLLGRLLKQMISFFSNFLLRIQQILGTNTCYINIFVSWSFLYCRLIYLKINIYALLSILLL